MAQDAATPRQRNDQKNIWKTHTSLSFLIMLNRGRSRQTGGQKNVILGLHHVGSARAGFWARLEQDQLGVYGIIVRSPLFLLVACCSSYLCLPI